MKRWNLLNAAYYCNGYFLNHEGSSNNFRLFMTIALASLSKVLNETMALLFKREREREHTFFAYLQQIICSHWCEHCTVLSQDWHWLRAGEERRVGWGSWVVSVWHCIRSVNFVEVSSLNIPYTAYITFYQKSEDTIAFRRHGSTIWDSLF